MPVIDDSGKLVGIITLDDILKMLADEFRGVERILQKESPDSLRDTAAVL